MHIRCTIQRQLAHVVVDGRIASPQRQAALCRCCNNGLIDPRTAFASGAVRLECRALRPALLPLIAAPFSHVTPASTAAITAGDGCGSCIEMLQDVGALSRRQGGGLIVSSSGWRASVRASCCCAHTVSSLTTTCVARMHSSAWPALAAACRRRSTGTNV